jgi:hypothetical protein
MLVGIYLARDHSKTVSPMPCGQSASTFRPTLALRCGLSREKIAKLSTAGASLHRSHGQALPMADYERFKQMLDSWRVFARVRNVLTLDGVLDRHLSGQEDTDESEERVESGSYAHLMEDMERSEDTVDFMPQIQGYLAEIREYWVLTKKRSTAP